MRILESGYHEWICFDHSHPHIFKDGKCINCEVKKNMTTVVQKYKKIKKLIESIKKISCNTCRKIKRIIDDQET